MSVAATNISCDRCGYKGSTGVVWGIFKYQTPLGKISLPRVLGWCEDCQSLAPIEDASVASRHKSLKGDVESLEACLEEEINSAKKNAPLLSRIFSRDSPDSEEIRKLRASMENLIAELQIPTVLNSYLMSIRKPRCLTCGSSKVFEFPKMPEGLNRFDDKDRKSVAIGVRHHGCGGEMYATKSEVRLNIRFRERLYSLSGERIA